jgi:GNAT superfamily N-acetyltransferase
VEHVIRPFQPADLEATREIFREYARRIGGHICFENFEREVLALPGDYNPILLSFEGNALVGCAGLHEIEPGIGELKRLYVRPEQQGKGLGRALVLAIIEEARRQGHRALRLDTLPSMTAAITLYRDLGFREILQYGDNPEEGFCFELSLSPA